jgi:hypothetical protein
MYDPRKGDTIRERLSLQGNPAVTDDWYVNPKTGKQVDFIDFCRSEGRFAKHFDKDGNPSETLLRARADRLANWHLLQELAGIRAKGKTEAKPVQPAEKAKPVAAQGNHGSQPNGNGHAAGNGHAQQLAAGSRIKYFDGQQWIPGVLDSTEPAVLRLSDGSVIRTEMNVVLAGLQEGVLQQDQA